MSDKKTKVDCKLTTIGTDGANAKIIKDLNIPDPHPAVGKKIIEDAIEDEKDLQDGNQQ